MIEAVWGWVEQARTWPSVRRSGGRFLRKLPTQGVFLVLKFNFYTKIFPL